MLAWQLTKSTVYRGVTPSLSSLSVSNWAHWICSSGGCLYTSINSDMEQGWEPCVHSCQSGNPSLHELILSLCCWNPTNVRSDQLRGGRSPWSSRCPSSPSNCERWNDGGQWLWDIGSLFVYSVHIRLGRKVRDRVTGRMKVGGGLR